MEKLIAWDKKGSRSIYQYYTTRGHIKNMTDVSVCKKYPNHNETLISVHLLVYQNLYLVAFMALHKETLDLFYCLW